MKGVVFPVCAIASWVAMAMRALVLRHGWDPAVLTTCVCLGLSGLTFTLSSPAVPAGLDRVLGIPDLAAFCIHVSAVGLGFAIPADQAKRIADELVSTGTATHASLGVQLGDDPTAHGAAVAGVAEEAAEEPVEAPAPETKRSTKGE